MVVPDTPLFSMGTAAVVKTITEMDRASYPIDTVFINYGTILRNCLSNVKVKEALDYDKAHNVETTKPTMVLISEFNSEIARLVETIALKLASNNVTKPTIVGYHACYNKIVPPTYYRIPPKGKNTLTQADNYLSASTIKEALGGINTPTTILSFMFADARPIRRHLETILNGINNHHAVVMVTNHYMDCHIAKACAQYTLVRSFTGAAVSYKALSGIVFDNNTIPFNTYTHALLGDSEDIKSKLPAVVMRSIEETATTELWSIKTTEFVRERLEQLGVTIPFML